MIRKLAHVAIVVRSLEESLPFYTETLGLGPAEVLEYPDRKLRIALVPAGESQIELLESQDPQSDLARFLEKRGEGLHHISLEVDDLSGELSRLAGAGVPLIDSTPRPTPRAEIAFLHPSAARGVLIELEAEAREVSRD